MSASARDRRPPAAALLPVATALLVTLASPAVANGQTQQASRADPLVGRVVHGDRAVPGTPVTLHRVASNASGEVATTLTDADGGFRFTLEPVPEAPFTVFFVTADYLSVRYLGRPIHAAEPGEPYEVAVFDTASVAPEPIRIVRRDMVLIPERSGAWEVNEVIRILNPTAVALVSTGGQPIWSFRIPEAASDFETGEGSVLPHEIIRVDDRVVFITPLIPGERDLFIRYRVPERPRRSSVAVEEPTDTFNLFVRQPSHLTGVAGLSTTRLIEAGGERFLQYGEVALEPGARIHLQWTRASGSPVDPVAAAVAVTILLLAAGAWAATRYRPDDAG
jgi:hypothetical protein